LRQTIVRGSVTDVAVAKLAINATLSMRAAWANEVGWKASNMGADPAIVFQALSAEPRIGGTSYMMPGPPPGGPCLPRDLVVWSDLDHEWNPGRVPNLPRWARASEARARTRDDNSTITDAVSRTHDIANEVLVDRAVTFAKEKVLHDGGTVGIIGLGYKLHAHDITESIGPRIATALHHERYKVLGYDPSVTALVRRHHPAIEMVDGAREFARRADAIIICLPYHEDMEFLREADLSQRPILQLHVLGS
jgi:UDP-glucose 6-dehydrogenase